MRLRFQDVLGLSRKTLTQDVFCEQTHLGIIKWYAAWRRYCFFPHDDCLFDASCLKEVYEHLEKLMKERRESQEYIARHSGVGPL